MVETIHQSSLNMALRCGEQFRRRYIEGEIIPPSIAAARGTGVHGANEVNLRHKVKKGSDLPLDDLKDAARDKYVKTISGGIYLAKEDRPSKAKLLNEGLNDTLRCTKVYGEEVAPNIHPVAIEEPFEIDVGLELPLAGQMDYQEKPIVGDLKTTSKKWQEGRIRKEIQPILYSFVHEKTRQVRPEFIYHILIARRNKEGIPTSEELQTQSITPSNGDYEALLSKLEMFIKMLKAGVFVPANPTSWWCDPKWCGYWETCPYVGNPKHRREI